MLARRAHFGAKRTQYLIWLRADFDHALQRVGLLRPGGSKKGAVPYSVGGTVPADGLNHFIFAPFFDPSEGRFQRSVAHA